MASAASFCTTQQVQGTYSFLANGSILVPNQPITGPFMRIGYFTADGNGTMVADTLAIYNGINFGPEHYGGTYTVTSDCAIDFHIAVPAPINGDVEFRGQVAANGNDITFILFNAATVPPITTVVGFGKKRSQATCSNSDLTGAWRIELNGTLNLPPIGQGTAYRTVGQIAADGQGGLLVSLVTSNNGNMSLETGSGKYTILSDCTFDLNYSIGTTPYSVRGSLIDPNNAFAGLNQPGQTVPNVGVVSGAVAYGSMVKENLAATLTATPNPIPVGAAPYGVTTITWNAPSAQTIEVHVGSPNGNLFTRNGSTGSQVTGAWVTDGMTFYLQDVSSGQPLTSDNTLTTVTVHLTK
jgi:hypothetical protein